MGRSTLGRSTGEESIAGDDVALRWTVGMIGFRSAGAGSARAEVRARGRANRGASIASSEGTGGMPGVDGIVCTTPDARSIGTFVLGARSIDGRAGTETSVGIRCTRAASVGTR